MIKFKKFQGILLALLLIIIGVYAYISLEATPEDKNRDKASVTVPKVITPVTDSPEQLALNLCQSESSSEIIFHDNYSWSIEMTPDIIAPAVTAYCQFEYKESPFTLIISNYKSAEAIKASIKDSVKTNGYLFLGVPSGLYDAKLVKDKNIYQALISTDDCGMDGEEYMDTGCPQGDAVFFQKNNTLIILANRFEENLPKDKLSSRDVYQNIFK